MVLWAAKVPAGGRVQGRPGLFDNGNPTVPEAIDKHHYREWFAEEEPTAGMTCWWGDSKEL